MPAVINSSEDETELAGVIEEFPIGTTEYSFYFKIVDIYGKYKISTVNVMGVGVFETMIFDAKNNSTEFDNATLVTKDNYPSLKDDSVWDFQKRYLNWNEAERGHREVCSWFKNAKMN